MRFQKTFKTSSISNILNSLQIGVKYCDLRYYYYYGRLAVEGHRVVTPQCPRSTTGLQRCPMGQLKPSLFKLVVPFISRSLRVPCKYVLASTVKPVLMMQVVDTRLPEHYRGDHVPLSHIVVDALTAANLTLRRRMLRGHMLSAVNVPWTTIVDRQSGRLVDCRRLVDVFQTAGVDVRQPLTTTGYVGSTACLGALAAVHCGARDVAVYSGSWTEWAQLADIRLVERGDRGRAVDGLCSTPWDSSKTEFMSVVADM